MVRGCVVVTALVLSLPALAGASTAASTNLTISVYPNGIASSVVHRYTLRCNPTGGSAPRPLRACRALARLASPFAPVPPHTLCAQISGGPQEAVVKGVLRGRRVDARLNLRGSCEIERWRRLSRVVPGFPASA
jgi:hypothetical protein